MQFVQLVDPITKEPFLMASSEIVAILPHRYESKDGETYEGCILTFKPILENDKWVSKSHLLAMSYSALKSKIRGAPGYILILEGDSIR